MVPIIMPVFCLVVKEGAGVGEAAGQLDSLEQSLWQPWQGRQYASVSAEPKYHQLLSLNSGDVIDIGSPTHPLTLQQPAESEGSQSALLKSEPHLPSGL